MQLKTKIVLRQKGLGPEYNGEFTLKIKENGINRIFTFDFRRDQDVKVFASGFGRDSSSLKQMIDIKKDGKTFIRVSGMLTEKKIKELPSQQGMILGIFMQLLNSGIKKISKEHGLDNPALSESELASAINRTFESTVGGSAEISDSMSKIICDACE